jgi:Lrp/AsnC family leucine-responsive transcriptional regulator
MTAFVHMGIEDLSRVIEIGQIVAAIEQVQEVHYLAGEDCLMAKMKISGNKELESILRTRIAPITAIKKTKTFIALSTYKESAKIKLPDTVE